MERHIQHPVSGGVDGYYERSSGTALCLSGGGFRAALFHLGALRRLNEAGILREVDTICSVSGGSILSAFIAKIATLYGWPIPPEHWQARVSIPFRKFVSEDLRTPIVLRKYTPWNVFRPGFRVRLLQSYYENHLTGGMCLHELPDRPRFIFCATDLDLAWNWLFSKSAVGSEERGFFRPPPSQQSDWTLARAVAASSCFPPIFGPMRIALDDLTFDNPRISGDLQTTVSLRDGGVFDNFGIEPVWHTHAVVIVSDGGAPFRFKNSGLFFPGLQSALAVAQHQASALRKRWFVANLSKGPLQGTYFGIASSSAHFGDFNGYPAHLPEAYISRIRTDLNQFTKAEQDILENHGFLIAHSAASKFLDPGIPPWPDVPNPHWGPFGQDIEIRVAEALTSSHKRISLRSLAVASRLQNLRNWLVRKDSGIGV